MTHLNESSSPKGRPDDPKEGLDSCTTPPTLPMDARLFSTSEAAPSGANASPTVDAGLPSRELRRERALAAVRRGGGEKWSME